MRGQEMSKKTAEAEWVGYDGSAYIPAPDLLWRFWPKMLWAGHIGDRLQMLDVGGGSGIVGERHWRRLGFDILVADVWDGYPETRGLVHVDARNVLAYFGPKSFDLVQCCDLIEHLPKEDGHQLLEDLKKVARVMVVLTTPTGFTVQDPELSPNEPWAKNPYQKHVCGWLPPEFEEHGYRIWMNGRNERGTYAGAYTTAFYGMVDWPKDEAELIARGE